MPLDIVILGPPGAGKGTQAALIANEAGLPHIATGEMLRAAIAGATPLGSQVKDVVGRGDLVGDELMIDVIRDRLSQPDTMAGFVLDGFPRTLPQAEALDRLLDDLDRELTIVLHFQIPEELAEQRLLERGHQEGRTDDTPDVIRHRIEVQRVPDELVEYYRAKGNLIGVHAEGSREDVFAEVQQVLETAAAR
jgi:adenylate kinase